MEQYLRCYVDYQQDNWSRLLSSAEFAYNNAAHEGTKETPFFLEYGRHPRAGPTIVKELQRSDLNDIMWNRQQAQEHAKAALKLAAERMKWYYDQGVQKVPFKVGDKVLIDLRNYQTSGRKLVARYQGPLEIVDKLSPVTFKVKWPPRWTKMHPVFHASKLIPYNEATIPGQKGPVAQPEMVDGHEEWAVEKILSSRRLRRKLQYLVRWKNTTPEEDTWEPAENLKGAPDAVREYHEAHPQAIRTLDDNPGPVLIQRDSTLRVDLQGGKEPMKRTRNAAGFDLYARLDQEIASHTRVSIPTGVRIQLPTGTYGRIAPRSISVTHELETVQGVIDRDHTGEIQVILENNSNATQRVKQNDPIAQLIIERIANCDIEVTKF